MITRTHFLKFLITALLTFLFSHTSAIGKAEQVEITGKVTDAESGATLYRASVLVEGTTAGTETDSRGVYLISCPQVGDCPLRFSHVGYETAVVSPDLSGEAGQVRLDVQLTPKPHSVKGITVSTTRVPIDLGEAASKPIEMTRRDIQTVPQFGEDLYRAATRLPGVATNDYSARFVVRGGDHEQVLVLLDGIELSQPFHLREVDGGAISIIDVAAIEKADLMTGGFSAHYGDRLSGVFDLKTRDPQPGTQKVSAAISLTNMRAMTEGTFAGDRGAWLVSARRGYIDLVLKYTDQLANVYPKYYDMMGKLRYRLHDNHTLSAYVLHAHDDLEYDSTSYSIIERTESTYDNSYLSLRFQSQLSTRLSIMSSVSFGRLDHERDGYSYERGSLLDYEFTAFDYRNTHEYSLRQDWKLDLSGQCRLDWGVDVKTMSTDYDYRAEHRDYNHFGGSGISDYSRAYFDTSGTHTAAYVSSHLALSKLLAADIGYRYDQTSYAGDKLLSPRINLTFTFTSKTSLRLAWGKYYQTQDVDELTVRDDDYKYYPAELAKHTVIGLEHQLSDKVNLRLEAYNKSLSELRPDIRNWLNWVQVFPEEQEDRIVVYRDGSLSKGVEFVCKQDNHEHLNWWLSYALSETTDEVTEIYDGIFGYLVDEEIPGNFDQRHALNIDISYRPNPGWQFNLAWRWHTGWPYTNDLDPWNDVSGLNQMRNPSYHRLDVRVNRWFRTSMGSIALFIEVINLYDRDNVYSYVWREYCSTSDRCYKQKEPLYWLGILPSAGVSWTLEL